MAYPQGINFRGDPTFTTDVSPAEVEPGTVANENVGPRTAYPRTTAAGNTVGWEGVSTDTLTVRSRSATNDARLAGYHQPSNGVTESYRLDLPGAGAYNIRFAAGDASYSQTTGTTLFDTTTSLGALCSGTTGAANSFKDAANSTFTAANWPANNALVKFTFTTSICRFKTVHGSLISHLYIESAGSLPVRNQFLSQAVNRASTY